MTTPMFHLRNKKVNTDIKAYEFALHGIDNNDLFVEFVAVAVREHNFYRDIHGVPDVASFSSDVWNLFSFLLSTLIDEVCLAFRLITLHNTGQSI